jgi:competence ComEA-like helix-hairpin-helix protein
VSIFYWLSLVSFIALLVLCGRLSYFVHQELLLSSACTSVDDKVSAPHPFLCGHKIKISQASVADLATIDGISSQKAQAIHDFFLKGPPKSIEDVILVQGVGPKTLEKLLVRFY